MISQLIEDAIAEVSAQISSKKTELSALKAELLSLEDEKRCSVAYLAAGALPHDCIAKVTALREAISAEAMCRTCTINLRWPVEHPEAAGCDNCLSEPPLEELLEMPPSELVELLPALVESLEALSSALDGVDGGRYCDYCMHTLAKDD